MFLLPTVLASTLGALVRSIRIPPVIDSRPIELPRSPQPALRLRW
jgi:hypothetical protein